MSGAAASSTATPTPIQSVRILRAEKRTLPTTHIVYAILVGLSVRSWTVFRRYSEFAGLHESLCHLPGSAGPPPAPLPAKHTARHTYKVILGLGGLVPQGESSRAADEALAEQRRVDLEMYLRAIVSSPEPAWRESDEFRAFLEMPKDTQAKTVLGSGSAANHLPRPRYIPGTFATSESTRSQVAAGSPSSRAQTTPTTRTFGAPSAPIQESDTTRVLNDRQLMASQEEQMQAQDQQLDGLAAVLRRQRAMGLAINQELLEQSELLENLDQDVDQTQQKMHKADRQMERLR